MDITQLLINAQAADFQLRHESEQQLKQLEDASFPTFAATLAEELGNESKPPAVRQLAGLLLKNKFDARSAARREELARRWAAVEDNDARKKVKNLLLQTLNSVLYEARHTAAQVIAALSMIELPLGLWNDLIELLLNNVINKESTEALQESSLNALGYICETASENQVDAEILKQKSNQILTAVVRGIEETDDKNAVRFAAINALVNAVDFAKANFENEIERNYIMTTVCNAATSTDERIRTVAFECLVKIAEYYYDFLNPFMNTLFQLSVNAISNDVESVALQGIEFWTTIAEEELFRIQEEEENNRTHHSMNYITQALHYLCPVLLRCLLLQEEEQDEDTWNRATASGACLTLMAQVGKDSIVPFVIQFVQEHIGNAEDWRSREGATLAFGSILEPEGPSIQGLEPLVAEAVPVLLNLLTRDSHVAVRDTSAWTLGRVCSISKEVTRKYLQPLMEAALHALHDEPRVASNAAWIFLNIAETFESEHDASHSDIDPYAKRMIETLLEVATREDSSEHHLRASCYEAFASVIQTVSTSNRDVIFQCIPLLLSRLESTFQLEISSMEARNEQAETQGLLCAALQSIIHRIRKEVEQFGDRMMQAFLFVLSSSSSSSEHEEALMAIGGLADALGEGFNKYMPHFAPFLNMSLRNWDQVDVCKIAVGVVSDVCRAIERAVLPYSDEIVMHLLTALGSPELDRSVKPPIITCFGDLALAICGSFERYFSHIMPILQQAAQASLSLEIAEDDFDTQDWVIELRESILQTFTAIIQGLRTDDKQNLIVSGGHSEWILQFCERVIQDKLCCTEKVVAAVVGVVGDIASALDGLRPALKKLTWIQQLIEKCSESPDKNVQNVAIWAKGIVY
eukprot:jgi/Galph1/5327/GphlegSOOS_G3958.1